MDMRRPHRCIWLSVAVIWLLLISLPASAASVPTFVASTESVSEIDAARQTQPVEARAKVMLDKIVFRYEHIYFEFDSAKLLPGAFIALDRKVEWLRRNPSARLLIEGHCDVRGPQEYNLALGKRRALAVRDYIMAQGIAPQRIRIGTWGEARPQVAQDGDQAWSWNRRAEFLPQ